MPKINREEYELLKKKVEEEIYSWDGTESGWGEEAVGNVWNLMDQFFLNKGDDCDGKNN